VGQTGQRGGAGARWQAGPCGATRGDGLLRERGGGRPAAWAVQSWAACGKRREKAGPQGKERAGLGREVGCGLGRVKGFSFSISISYSSPF